MRRLLVITTIIVTVVMIGATRGRQSQSRKNSMNLSQSTKPCMVKLLDDSD